MDTEDGVSQKEKEFKIKDEPLAVEKPVKMEDKDASPEARKKAEKVIFETLDLDPSIADLENFQEKLQKAIESIPRYQELEQKLADVPPDQLPYELFKALQKSADTSESYDHKKVSYEDGVLVKQIKNGSPLMCAGRSMIASSFLQKRGIDHSIISTFEGNDKEASGHSAILINIDKDSLAYFDASNDLHFTFPRSALRGYEGSAKTTECFLEEYAPRKKDIIDGLSSMNTRFISIPADEGVVSQYLNNVSAALGGNKEFAKSSIIPDNEAKEAVDQLKDELIGENPALAKYKQRGRIMEKQIMARVAENKKTALLALEKFPEKNRFISVFSSLLHNNYRLSESYPYLQNAPENIRRQAAEKIWDHLQKTENASEEKSEKEIFWAKAGFPFFKSQFFV